MFTKENGAGTYQTVLVGNNLGKGKFTKEILRMGLNLVRESIFGITLDTTRNMMAALVKIPFQAKAL